MNGAKICETLAGESHAHGLSAFNLLCMKAVYVFLSLEYQLSPLWMHHALYVPDYCGSTFGRFSALQGTAGLLSAVNTTRAVQCTNLFRTPETSRNVSQYS